MQIAILGGSGLRRLLLLWFGGAVLSGITIVSPVPPAMAAPSGPTGVWLMGVQVAIQVFDCDSMLCGRIIWLKAPLDPQGLLKRDKLNPDPALRERQLCGPTIIRNLRTGGGNRWEGGSFYNPNDGTTYGLSMKLKSPDVMSARIYKGIPLFGETRTLVRIPMGISKGWC
ncbi:MAG: DUF2147 domain-containing protein [Parvibaculum sp.]